MVHWSIGNDFKLADMLFSMKGCLVLQDYLFFSLHSFSYKARKVTTLKQLGHFVWVDASNSIFERHCLVF